jgi:extracellular factor (EF) 3-hydroxypalmitic acid methyl ester biosynthesis protein
MLKVITPQFVVVNPTSPLLSKIKHYRRAANEFQSVLAKKPGEWGKYQSSFNQEINGIFRDILIYEKERIHCGDMTSFQKFKKLFRERLEKYFSYGEYILWSQRKPYGYAGDFKMIDSIYDNSPKTQGFERLYDNYMMTSTISVAVRHRKEDFKKIIMWVIRERTKRPLRIMSLACGPCRELREIAQDFALDWDQIYVDGIDHDPRALEYSEKFFTHMPHFRFLKRNAIRMALNKDITRDFEPRYDLIYTTGLFDYLDVRVAIRLIRNLKKLLTPEGVLAISDVQEKFSNPSLPFMELVGEWDLIYRNTEEFRRFFIESGFRSDQLTYKFEQQGIMQYIIARND